MVLSKIFMWFPKSKVVVNCNVRQIKFCRQEFMCRNSTRGTQGTQIRRCITAHILEPFWKRKEHGNMENSRNENMKQWFTNTSRSRNGCVGTYLSRLRWSWSIDFRDKTRRNWLYGVVVVAWDSPPFASKHRVWDSFPFSN